MRLLRWWPSLRTEDYDCHHGNIPSLSKNASPQSTKLIIDAARSGTGFFKKFKFRTSPYRCAM
jgi:hypothetical protein